MASAICPKTGVELRAAPASSAPNLKAARLRARLRRASDAINLQRLTQVAPNRRARNRCVVINRSPGGTGSIVAMRRACFQRWPDSPNRRRSRPILHLLSSWFNPGSRTGAGSIGTRPHSCSSRSSGTRRCTRSTVGRPLRHRLQPGPPLFAFHPQLPASRQIFVEVALLPAMPAAIAPLIDKDLEPLPAKEPVPGGGVPSATASPGSRGRVAGQLP